MTYIDTRQQSRDWANKLANRSVENQPLGDDNNPVEDAENVLLYDDHQTSLLTPPLRSQVVRLRIGRNFDTVICKVEVEKQGNSY